MDEHDDSQVATVAVWLPGTDHRVLVTMLGGDDDEARRTAKTVVQQFAFVAPVRWLTRVIERGHVTDVPQPHPIKEAP